MHHARVSDMAYVRLQVILRQIPTNTAERCPGHSQHTDENLRFLLDVHAWRCCPVRLPASPYRLQLSVSRSPFLSTHICRETNDDAHCGCTGRKNAPSLALSRRLSSNVTPRFLRPSDDRRYRVWYHHTFKTLAQAFYFVLVTCTTIGYGDMPVLLLCFTRITTP